MDVVLTADKNYILQLCVTMYSVAVNTSKNVRFHLFVSGCENEERHQIERMTQECSNCEMFFYDVDEYVHLFKDVDVNTFMNKYINLVCYYRLLMFKILPEDVKKCFYIDCDIIVDTDIGYLHDNMDGSFGAVVESLAMCNRGQILKHLYDIEDFENFKTNEAKYPYFNAGFFLIDLEWAREVNLWEKVWEFFGRYPNLPYADQDILNAVIGQKFREKIKYWNPEYNVFCDKYIKLFMLKNEVYDTKLVKRAHKHPLVYHYAGECKPWLYKRCRFYNVWWKYLKMSCYASGLKYRIPKLGGIF